MKVVKWIADSAVADDAEVIGGLGGGFGFDARVGKSREETWDSWFTDDDPDYEYLVALRDEIIAKDIWQGGFWHQGSNEGVPVFEDGKVFCTSMRSWGDLMAATWTYATGKQYAYVDFAWDAIERPG